jgi:hypothetical protein
MILQASSWWDSKWVKVGINAEFMHVCIKLCNGTLSWNRSLLHLIPRQQRHFYKLDCGRILRYNEFHNQNTTTPRAFLPAMHPVQSCTGVPYSLRCTYDRHCLFLNPWDNVQNYCPVILNFIVYGQHLTNQCCDLLSLRCCWLLSRWLLYTKVSRLQTDFQLWAL